MVNDAKILITSGDVKVETKIGDVEVTDNDNVILVLDGVGVSVTGGGICDIVVQG